MPAVGIPLLAASCSSARPLARAARHEVFIVQDFHIFL